MVLGAGGAATAIQVQLALEGTEEIHIFNRRDEFYDRVLETQRKLKEKGFIQSQGSTRGSWILLK